MVGKKHCMVQIVKKESEIFNKLLVEPSPLKVSCRSQGSTVVYENQQARTRQSADTAGNTVNF